MKVQVNQRVTKYGDVQEDAIILAGFSHHAKKLTLLTGASATSREKREKRAVQKPLGSAAENAQKSSQRQLLEVMNA
jgi:hypothetical protein